MCMGIDKHTHNLIRLLLFDGSTLHSLHYRYETQASRTIYVSHMTERVVLRC